MHANLLSSRQRAAVAHLLISATVAGLIGLLILRFWYPGPWAQLAGGRDLFWLVLGVDIALGPLITLVIFNVSKPRTELVRDVAVVAVLQLAALAYGLNTVAEARPAVLALEKDRIRAIRPADLDKDTLQRAPEGLRNLSWSGFLKVATRPVTSDEQMDVIDKALQGVDVGQRPEFWLPPNQTQQTWAAAGKPLAKLQTLHPTRKADIDAAVKTTGKPESDIKWLAILARNTDHTALIDAKTGDIVGYAPVDGN